jgi:metal-sulfur cluster biosynthetic enzyme
MSLEAATHAYTLSPEEQEALEMEVWDALDSVKDPCHLLSGHDLSILDLGLVNRVEVRAGRVEVGLTVTEVGCTFAYRIIEQIEDLAPAWPEIERIKVVIEPFPLWTPDRLSARAKTHYQTTRLAFGPAGRPDTA